MKYFHGKNAIEYVFDAGGALDTDAIQINSAK
jgi:hypothetical protein